MVVYTAGCWNVNCTTRILKWNTPLDIFYKVLVLDLIMAPNVILEGIEFKVPCGETIWWIFVLYSHALKVHAEIL